MRTACGAVLIASQLTDTVECGGGETAPNRAAKSPSAAVSYSATAASIVDTSANTKSTDRQFDDKFILQDAETGEPISYAEYAIRRESGAIEHGTSDAEGHTHLLSATANAEVIEIYV